MEHFDNIANWMTKDPVFVDISATLKDTISRMGQNKIGAILIFNNNDLAGIFTERDLLAIVDKLSDMTSLKRPIAEHPFTCENSRVKVTMSFGIAEYPTDAKGYEDLIRCADIAMYRACKI